MNTFNDYLNEIKEVEFKGWDFAYLDNRYIADDTSWTYLDEVSTCIKESSSLLDMGTGGGELLMGISSILPKQTCATEGYAPNIEISRERLGKIGIEVFPISDDSKLPFKSEQFDLVINRHESYSASEVHRILKPKGVFISQQVGGNDLRDLNRALGDFSGGEYENWNLSTALNELTPYFSIQKSFEEFPFIKFSDIGAVIFYLNACP